MDEIEEIHKNYAKIQVKKLIPCNCEKCISNINPHFFDFNTLKYALLQGNALIQCYNSFESINIESLIKDIDLSKRKKNILYDLSKESLYKNKANVNLYISYNNEDKILKNEFTHHLSSLIRQNKVSVWDDRFVNPGDDWENKIFNYLYSSDIIVLLISHNYIASDFCFSKEMPIAIERSNNDGVFLIPVILNPCDWDSLPIGKIQTLPRNKRPISLWEEKSSAFKEIIDEIHLIVDLLNENTNF
ncbi:MAG: toll/interleukin-1 receptor domain-containing protein [Saprospiraceae bacterium]